MKKFVKVYDRINQDRLLGTMLRWSMPRPHTHYRAVCGLGPVTAYRPDVMPEMTVEHVTFERTARVSKDGWSAEVIVITDAPLSALMRLPDFRVAEGDGFNPNWADIYYAHTRY